MSYVCAAIVFAMAVRIGWTAHGLFVDWKRKRNAKWVTVEIANGAVMKARVEDVNWAKLFGYDEAP